MIIVEVTLAIVNRLGKRFPARSQLHSPAGAVVFMVVALLSLPPVCVAASDVYIVVDEANQKPLAGVFVILNRLASVSLGVQSRTTCISYGITQTDANGRFTLPALPADVLARVVGRIVSEGMSFYAPGYRDTRTRRDGRFVLGHDARPLAERYKDLGEIAGQTDCGSDTGRNERAIPLYRAMYAELRAGATTPAERQMVRDWAVRLDIVEFGYDEGKKRTKAREADYFGRCIRLSTTDPVTGNKEIVPRKGVDTSDCDWAVK